MLLDVRQGLLIMVYLTLRCNAVACASYIPFEVPCESNTQNEDNKGLKIGLHLEISEKIITLWDDLVNPNFPHALFTSVIACDCDNS